MPKLKVGTTISCRVRSAQIVSPYRDYDEIRSFVIVSTDDQGYFLYVPHYYGLKDTFVLDKYRRATLEIDPKYLGEEILHIPENLIATVTAQLDGAICQVCREFSPYAEANRPGGVFVCFSCNQNPYH